MKHDAPFYRFFKLFILFSSVIYCFPSSAIEWPQKVHTTEGTLIVYQPQPEKLIGNALTARAAMSFTQNKEPIFGVFWFTAKIDTDRENDSVTVRDMSIIDVRWPESKDAGEQTFTTVVNQAIKTSQFNTSLSQLTASLENAEVAEQSLAQLKTDPPIIIFKDKIAVLLSFDGEPKFSAIKDTHYERALNTAMTVIKDTKNKTLYLTDGHFWYQAKQAKGPYKHTQSVPADLANMLPKNTSTSSLSSPPEIVVATKPTELVVTDGEAKWKSLSGGELMYVFNTETPWLREMQTNNMYVLLSGRWFRAKQHAGPWTFVRADELPQSFANIPPESDLGGLRDSVAGTEEANEAVLDAKVPQTAAISRKDARLTVYYDGKPKFARIPGTNVSYAINTDAQVLQIKGKYYAVDNAVWFKADSAQGPWLVADSIPKNEIAKIPPSSPVYNLTYVEIYESTPDVVYTGYYPGYVWSYPYYGAPVYGTGWYYPAYWGGGYYYPRPSTWGFNIGYNNWTGWSFGVSWSNGFLSLGMNWDLGWPTHYRPYHCCNGWYGGGYRGPVVINTGDINIGNSVNIGNKLNNLNNKRPLHNIYKRSQIKTRLASKTQVKRDLKTAISQRDKANNIFADRNGNVLKHDDGKWQQRVSDKWQDVPSDKQQQIKDHIQNTDRQHVQNKLQTIDKSKAKHTLQQRQQSHTQQTNRMQQLNQANRARQLGMQRQQMRRNLPKQMPRQMPNRGH
ncbi:carbohydrate-binding family V/XII [Pseudoalteromonas lipolytica SCSIO 04301]|uniref:carbohydrate-binding family V/XII n=1 Tax=Pseudoalteromonas lipolytica TaxID=570156 RepID=UPI00045208F4|nr:carbohydrate-binding family V/XII [Pseudoalteromonas lipolytica]EWH05322.1 carbohydrate-binding family V/XII [Pseudoalteromonas lipolytica SCSIO 04301]